MPLLGVLALLGGVGFPAQAQDDVRRFRVLPLPGNRASVVDHTDYAHLTWHFGFEYPRPFFYPFRGASGGELTRMGHPGAPNHDHHRSIWFAHNDVGGNDFWSDKTKARIRQKQWLVYEDGRDEVVMAMLLGWYDGEGRELMEQELVAAYVVGKRGFGDQLEVQSTFTPVGESIALGKTNFGFLGVRMAKRISVHFGDGRIIDSEGRFGEKEIFGQRARWVAYASPMKGVEGGAREGIAYFDHPSNPRYPTYWHVREDGWMGASFGMKDAYTIERARPLRLRYLLLAHERSDFGPNLNVLAKEFEGRPAFEVVKSTRPHRQYEVRRKPDPARAKQPDQP